MHIQMLWHLKNIWLDSIYCRISNESPGNRVTEKEAAPMLEVVQASQLYQDLEFSAEIVFFINKS
jgi:hypothetical protein